ncbi:hypothetical protein V1511DRAFT_513515 [Dipodascopsis uninucleata]
MNRRLTTADVPSQFLKDVFLVGSIPQTALRSDPRISYSLYIPPAHYNSDPRKSESPPKLSLLIYIHGTRRMISAIHSELVPFADSTPCAILAPMFPAGLDSPNDLDSYKLLRSETLRSDLSLLSILEEVAERWPGIATEKVYMMGFSGGGQFVHRFLYLYPDRLAAVSVGAPGRSTALDRQKNWPAGIADVEVIFEKTIRVELIREVSIQLVVGDKDSVGHGSKEFWTWLKKMKDAQRGGDSAIVAKKDEKQISRVLGRLQTVQAMHEAWMLEGINAQLDIVEGVAHSSNGVQEAVLRFLRPLIQKREFEY